ASLGRASEQEKQHEAENGLQYGVTGGGRRRYRQRGFSHRRVWGRRQDCVPEKDQAIGSRRRVPEAVTLHCWNGSVLERPFCQQSAPRIRTRAADHPGYLRQAVHEGAEERL